MHGWSFNAPLLLYRIEWNPALHSLYRHSLLHTTVFWVSTGLDLCILSKFTRLEKGKRELNRKCWNLESKDPDGWNPESRQLESGIQRVGIRNPESKTHVDSVTWGET